MEAEARTMKSKMWIVALILLATASTTATAAPLHLSCKGNVIKFEAETPDPTTLSVTIDGKWVTVEDYGLTQLLSDDNDDIWIFGNSLAEHVPSGQINALLVALRWTCHQGPTSGISSACAIKPKGSSRSPSR
jgi:hypothetical protein